MNVEPSVWHRLFARLAVAGNQARALGNHNAMACPMRALVKSLRRDELAALEKALEGGGHGEIPRANVCSSPDPPMRRLLEGFGYAGDPVLREERDVKAMIVAKMRNADPEAFAIVVEAVAEDKVRRG